MARSWSVGLKQLQAPMETGAMHFLKCAPMCRSGWCGIPIARDAGNTVLISYRSPPATLLD
jgi:hypothetical protein